MIKLADYDPSYPKSFAEFSDVLRASLGGLISSIEHVGSTAVPGLSGKPILDIIVVIDSLKQLDAVVSALEKLGYAPQGDLGIKDRFAFRRLDQTVPWNGSDRAWPVHHLYVCAKGNASLLEQIAFRDALLRSSARRDAYAALKKELSRNAGDDREAYANGKTDFIHSAIALA